MRNKVMVLTLGCHKNLVDSEKLIGTLEVNGINTTERFEEANTLIINTCGFISPAKKESMEVINQALNFKKQGKIEKVIVSGCLSERYLKEMRKNLKQVDFITGVDSIDKIVKYLNPDLKFNLLGERKLLTPKHYAYLKISEGCNHNCSFCVIPLIRGKYKSRNFQDIINEARQLVNNGVKEINIIAQDSTYYGIDLEKKSKLADLLKSLSEIEHLYWIRLLYAYPLNFPYNILDVINRKENICHYIDIPLQHISTKILKSMKRKMDYENTSKLIDKIRSSVDNVAIRTTFITGYPGETEEDFQELYDFVKEKEFDRVGVFTYSHEENSPAYQLIDDVPEEIKNERRNKLMELQMDISLKKNSEKIGEKIKVLIDDYSNGKYIGRTEYDAPEVDNAVIIKTDKVLNIGDFVNVKIVGAEPYDLIAEI